MNLSDFDYDLPPDLIAQFPAPERDRSRLMVVDRRTGEIRHQTFRDLTGFLTPGDVLVLNDTRVLAARLLGRRATGGAVQALVLRLRIADCGLRIIELLLQPAARLKPGEVLDMEDGAIRLRLVERTHEGHWLAEWLPDEKINIQHSTSNI